ncbi:TonB-dependent receptor [Cellvibrio japonicus]|uniref:Putative TonB dependent receptor n=1 Tax=Cellvibrio japonicus (strain Ueda107) TaxID=498211 RepID=B3PFC3_CELJU|nr:TonB-dependent receptor [Cellvibrio japonicus]ACE85363.1 putative TonB dependent receptor [Cellvibrio japonicus Ueda107]QEI10798.1 TonB-dependent receptor [Cellvibrio japonicus]QEI14374.1 TonB-dependent receptor [Cellvibrio japonicus]QEI17952.1 TonB-dependent receptor [Cellvibrio japonicus]
MHKKRLLPLCIALAASGHLYAQETDTREVVEEITVTGVRQAELNAREAERGKSIFSSVISQDDAGNFADQNVAESLQRLPGITLQKSEGEGRFISVRGLGPGFVSVQQNGSELASAGSDDRAFALDAIPADLLGAIEVFKSLTPDMDLNSIGGAVNVKTVSAFDRKKDSFRVTVQDYYQDYMEEHSPKVSMQGTHLFLDNTIGLGYSLSWEERKTANYEMLHHETTDMRYVQENITGVETPDPTDLDSYMLIPFEFQNRQEIAERERTAASIDLGWKPTDSGEYYLRSSYTKFTDNDLAWREYYRFGQAGPGDIAYLDRDTNTFGMVDTDIQQQMFIQYGESETSSASVGGKHEFEFNSGRLIIDGDISWSDSTYDKPDGKRVQFRVRDVPVIGRAGKEFIVGQAISADALAELAGTTTTGWTDIGGYSGAGINLAAFSFDNLFLEASSRADELQSYGMNFKFEIDEGFVSYWKAGFNYKERTRDRNQDRWSIVPRDESQHCPQTEDFAICQDVARNTNLSRVETAEVDHPSFVYPAITLNGANQLIDTVRAIATEGNQSGLESIYRDYNMSEDSFAAYFMGEFRLADNQWLIAGARWDETKFSSTGFLAINNDNFSLGNDETVKVDYSIPLDSQANKYDNVLPSLHYRWEPREDVLVRSSIWTSFTRPSYDQARAFANIESNFELCNPVTNVCSTTPDANTGIPLSEFTLGPNNTLRLGNPNLVAMTSVNYDASVSWYIDENIFLQAAFFYKDIDDYIVEVRGARAALDELPVRLPVDQVDAFIIPSDLELNNVSWTANGDRAKVYGAEFSYNHNFDNGLFLHNNLTVMSSAAYAGDSIRAGKTQLPEQADTTFNTTVGWENDVVSVRLIGNYVSDILKRIGSCPAGSEGYLIVQAGDDRSPCNKWADVYQDDTFSLDFKATWQVNKNIKIYFDAMNITDEYMTQYYEGNQYSGGNVMYKSEVYGRSFQIGLNYKFL